MIIRTFLKDVSRQLNDQKPGKEYTRWTINMLLSYTNTGLAEISGYKPDAFTATSSLVLVSGSYQTMASNVRLISVDSNTDGSLVHEADLDLLRAYRTYDSNSLPIDFSAQGTPQYHARSFAIDPKNPTTFYISPPVPVGLSPSVRVTVQDTVPEYTDSMLDQTIPLESKYRPNLWDYVLARAFELDMESRESRANAQMHFTAFWQAMGVKYKRETQFRNGFYNGQVGEGDSRVGP